MDCGSAGIAAGIDPKILDNWQTDGAFSVASWEHLGYEQPPEWDTSQESSQCADVADLGAFHDPLAGPLLDLPGDLQNRCASCDPVLFGWAEVLADIFDTIAENAT